MSGRRCPMPGPDGLACEGEHPEAIPGRVHHASIPGVQGAWVRWDFIKPAEYHAPPGVLEGLVALDNFLFALGDHFAELREAA